MDEKRRVELEKAGIDTNDALARFMENEALMMKFLLRFPEDPSFAQLQEAMEHGDAAQAFTAAHTLKGVAGNLSMRDLYGLVSRVVEDLRAGDLAGAASRMPELEKRYQELVRTLRALA